MEVIEILSDDDDDDGPAAATQRLVEEEEEEDSQEFCFLSTTPAPRKAPEVHVDGGADGAFANPVTLSADARAAGRPDGGGDGGGDDDDDDVVVLANPEDLSVKAKDQLLKSLLLQQEAMKAQMASLQQKAKSDESDRKQSARPVYWRRDGAGKRIAEDPARRGKVLVDLVAGSDEYESVATRVLTHGLPDAVITSIRRCHNDALWEPYRARRSAMARRMGGTEADPVFQHDLLPGVAPEGEVSGYAGAGNPCRERYLFHGASPATIDKILDENVDFRLSQVTGAMGACAYFADQSSYSDQYCRMPDHSAEAVARRGAAGRAPDPGSGLKMLVCRVLLGTCGSSRS